MSTVDLESEPLGGSLKLGGSTGFNPAWAFSCLALIAAVIWHLQTRTELSLLQQWQLWAHVSPKDFPGFEYVYSHMPRAVMAVIAGAALGLVGSLMQQLLQNPLVSPMTLGASSGAWLGIVAGSVLFPALVLDYREWWALSGAILATCLSLLVARNSGFRGLPIVLAGMAVSLLFGALASAVVLLNDQYVRNLFIWGAGDLAQVDWSKIQWLLPRLIPFFILIAVAHRPLMLMRLGEQGAQSRGMAIIPVIVGLLLLALWLTASVIAAVGLIGFVGLLTPQIARKFFSHSSRQEMIASAVLGALLLTLTDIIALRATDFFGQVVPSGAAAALIGAPALILLSLHRAKSAEASARGASNVNQSVVRVTALKRSPVFSWSLATGICFLILSLALFVFPKTTLIDSGAQVRWGWFWPEGYLWQLRWPRVLAALAAGFGLAVAGTVLQRLIRNPLASPDILGLSAGATLSIVLFILIFGAQWLVFSPVIAFAVALLCWHFCFPWVNGSHSHPVLWC